jgi:hypothetical protein
MASVNCCEQVAMDSMVAEDFSAKPWLQPDRDVTHHLLEADRGFGELIVHVFGLEV